MPVILVIDDKVEFHLLIKQIFRNMHEVHGVKTVRDARRLMERTQIDAVILEVNVPNGWDLLSRLSQQGHPYVIVVTVNADPMARKRANELGAASFFLRPFVPSQLRRFVKGLLG